MYSTFFKLPWQHTSLLTLFPQFPPLTHFLHDLFLLNCFFASSLLLSQYVRSLPASLPSWVGVSSSDVAVVSSPQKQSRLQRQQLVVFPFPSLFLSLSRWHTTISLCKQRRSVCRCKWACSTERKASSSCPFRAAVETRSSDLPEGQWSYQALPFHRSAVESSHCPPYLTLQRTKRKNNEQCPTLLVCLSLWCLFKHCPLLASLR